LQLIRHFLVATTPPLDASKKVPSLKVLAFKVQDFKVQDFKVHDFQASEFQGLNWCAILVRDH